MGLSFTSTSRIISEIYKSGLISMAGKQDNPKGVRGRKADFVQLNQKAGVVCAIDLAGLDIRVALSDLSNRILVEGRIPHVRFIDETVLEQVVATIKTLLSSKEVAGIPLLCICISSQGKINKNTYDYYYVRRIKDYEKLNLKTFFQKYFPVDVYVYNDIHIGCVGEKMYGIVPKDAHNILFAFLDEAAGFALILDDRLYEGTHGFAGEAESYNPVDEISSDPHRCTFYAVSQIYLDVKKAVEKEPLHPLHGKEVFSFEDLVALYQKGDSLVENIVNASAKINAMQFLFIADLLDLDHIVVYGKILDFGDKYKSLLLRCFKEYDGNRCTTEILFSRLQEGAALLGAMYQGSNLYLLKRFGDMTRKRTSHQDYDVRKFFGNNI